MDTISIYSIRDYKTNMRKIIIRHKVEIDHCIADEIKELNNKHNILTLYSCCGHDKDYYGYIVVHPDNISDMIELGYQYNGFFSSTGFNGTLKELPKEFPYKFPSFTAKSVCKGRC